MMEDLLLNHPRILAECAVAERLRRLPNIELHPTLFNAPLIYGPDSARSAMSAIYNEYLAIANRHNLPIFLSAPTWRLDRSRVAAANVPSSIVSDAVRFLSDLRSKAPLSQPPIAVGGLVGPMNDCYRPDLAPSTVDAISFHHLQIEQLNSTNVDFLIAQTLPSVAEAAGIAKVMSQSTKPYFISFCVASNGCVLDGTSLPDAMNLIDNFTSDAPPLGYFVNCTHPDFLLSNYEPQQLSRLVGIQANGSSRDVTRLDGSSSTIADPIASWTTSMLKLHSLYQVPILGGCCGTTEMHLDALAS